MKWLKKSLSRCDKLLSCWYMGVEGSGDGLSSPFLGNGNAASSYTNTIYLHNLSLTLRLNICKTIAMLLALGLARVNLWQQSGIMVLFGNVYQL